MATDPETNRSGGATSASVAASSPSEKPNWRLRQALKQIIEESETAAGRVFDLTIGVLVVLSLVSFSIETVPDLSEQVRALLRAVEIGTVAIFTLEYLLRIIVADNPVGYLTSFFGLIDLAAILPFYLTTGLDLRSLRAVRLLRLFRILKLARFGKAAKRLRRAFHIVREELVLFFIVACLLLYLAAVGIYYFENPAQPELFKSVFHCLWWAVATLTTVGYGDMYPITVGGRVFTFFVLMIGIGVVAVPAGLVTSALSQARREEEDPEADGAPGHH